MKADPFAAIQFPPEVRQRFETQPLREHVEGLKSELRKYIARVRGWDAFSVLGLYMSFATAIASAVVKANGIETFPDSAFEHAADEHWKFLNLWLPIFVKRKALTAVNTVGPRKLKSFLSQRPDRIKEFGVRIDSAIRKATRPEVRPSEQRTGTVSNVTGTASAGEASTARRGYRAEIHVWMQRLNIQKNEDAARKLRIGVDTLKSIMSSKGKKRYSDETLKRVLMSIGPPR